MIESRAFMVGPQPVVDVDIVWWLVVDHDDVGITVVIDVESQDAFRSGSVAGYLLLFCESSEGSVEIVVEEFVRAVGIDSVDIQVAIMIGIEYGAVDCVELVVCNFR